LKIINKTKKMSEIKIPTAGRIVHYFPNGTDKICENPFAPYVPAIVVESTDLAPSLSVFTLNAEIPVVLRLSVSHKSTVLNHIPMGPYWDWPEIK
jgi:hypothetical protein